ncbi:MAG: DUF4440 domain-containing protein [Micavibrio sp.]|nr:DUF4440 domain-containing protein [Micavibrio sp.]
MKPDFDLALQKHLAAIENRDLAAFSKGITQNPVLYTIVQNGHAFKTPAEIIAIHADWFNDSNWAWNGDVIHKVVGSDMAFAVLKYTYRASAGGTAFETWLTYVFAIEDGAWKIIHDQNTALDYHAFSRSMEESAPKSE